jgi:hypothetical protein
VQYVLLSPASPARTLARYGVNVIAHLYDMIGDAMLHKLAK